jgi:hypothetical protein
VSSRERKLCHPVIVVPGGAVNVIVTDFVTLPTVTVTVAMPAVRDVMFAAAKPFNVRCTVVGELLSVNAPKFVENVTCVSLGTDTLFCVALTATDTGVVADTVVLDADTTRTVELVFDPVPVTTGGPDPLSRLEESQPTPTVATARTAARFLSPVRIGHSFLFGPPTATGRAAP